MRRVATVLFILVGILIAGSHPGWASQQEESKVIMLGEQPPGPITFPKIDRKPKPNDLWGQEELKTLPKYDSDSDAGWQVDLRCRDLSKLDLRHSIDDLMYAIFDHGTVWPGPDRMPPDFDWQEIMELGKNPGLGVRTLHERGVTGKGVGVAIIDQTLLTEHQEYADRLRLYEENNIRDRDSTTLHGPAVASIAVGKTVGIAPEADLYYIATWDLTRDDDPRYNFVFRAQAIRRLLEINRQLPANRKIRVISNSIHWSPSQEGYDEITVACEEAKAAGIFVVTCGIIEPYDFDYGGLGRHPLSNPDSFESYGPNLHWAKIFYRSTPRRDFDTLWVPEDSRATASPTGNDEYVFYRRGGASWCAPYIAGIYALAVQVEPEITPERFWNLALKTGRIIELEHKGERRSFGLIIDPVRLIRAIQAGETAILNRQHSDNQNVQAPLQTNSKTQAIVPGARVGDYTLGMSKDDVLKKLGEPESIFWGSERYTLENLPRRYFMSYEGISFSIEDDSVTGIGVRSPRYKFADGLRVGHSEDKIKQALGRDFQLEESEVKDALIYKEKGLRFEIDKRSRTVEEIGINQPIDDPGGRGDNDSPGQEEHSKPTTKQHADRRSSKDLPARIHEAAADGHLAKHLTTPGEFKLIAGQPTKEWTELDGDFILMEYPGIKVRFFGKPNLDTPHTLFDVRCEGRYIDFGDGGIVLRNEGDLDKFGPFWGYCGVDLSRLDLSQKGKLLEARPFDNRTIWPKSDLLPPGFDPKRRLEWGKNPGLGVRSLHQEGITGKGVGIAVIDMPLLREHVEYADRIRSHHTTDVEGVDAEGHGTSVCSIAVGKTCGVAPGANLHYYAVPPWKWGRSNPGYARTVEQIVERNRKLPPSEKVRVISASIDVPQKDHYDEWRAAVDKAKKKGILVVICDKQAFRSIKRKVGTDPDDPNNYGPSHLFGDGNAPVYVPIANRSMATEVGKDAYTFDTHGGDSWGAPYLAGLAVLAFQVHPGISPDEIGELWQETATRTQLGPVVNPRGFIEAVKGL